MTTNVDDEKANCPARILAVEAIIREEYDETEIVWEPETGHGTWRARGTMPEWGGWRLEIWLSPRGRGRGGYYESRGLALGDGADRITCAVCEPENALGAVRRLLRGGVAPAAIPGLIQAIEDIAIMVRLEKARELVDHPEAYGGGRNI